MPTQTIAPPSSPLGIVPPPATDQAPAWGADDVSPHLAARDLAEIHGLHVLPVYEPTGVGCACPDATCPHPGKHPARATG
jgi:hypothetical protein